MGRIGTEVTVKAPAAEVFAYADDHSRISEWMPGISAFERLGTQDHGVGASYRATLRLGPKPVRSSLRVTHWERDRLLVLTSYEGVSVTVRIRCEPLDEATTRLSAALHYEFGTGYAGRTLTRVVDPLAQKWIEQACRELRRRAERLGRRRSGA